MIKRYQNIISLFLFVIINFVVTMSIGESYNYCSEYEIEKSYYCSLIKLKDENKQCAFVNNDCIELPNECSSYKGNNKIECESIVLSNRDKDDTKCVFKDGECIEENISCTETSTEVECQRKYYSCSEYTGNDIQTCGAIKLSALDKYCELEGTTCTEKKNNEYTCKDYKGLDAYTCSRVTSTDDKKFCYLINAECKEFYKECSDYKGSNEEECKLNIPIEEDYKCIYENGQCKKTHKECSDGIDFESCTDITPTNKEKKCYFIDYKCQEVFSDCETYGTNETLCNSIIPDDDFKKCIYEEGKCKEVQKECSDFKQGENVYDFCTDMSYDNKKCYYFDHECQEHFDECSDIEDKTKCESNINTHYNKCKFDDQNKCVEAYYQCSDYTKILDLMSSKYCEYALVPPNFKKKCVYDKTTHNCNEGDKKCLDYTKKATKEICENAKTSKDGKKCVLSDDNNRCIEIDENNSDDNTENSDKNNNNDNNGKINKITLFSLFLFLLFV